ncbi:hypothetical protein [Acinetobacter towneri]|uniref:hypothetical protein n=1 Tax=Acinetobacter towneri TaxID=202956 RepID=UPI001CE188C9|nr:hypothetical protein [Acinetobacter towneri]
MAIDKLPEFAKDGQKNTDDLVLTDGFPVLKKPARQWFNWLFNTLTKKINEIADVVEDMSNDIFENDSPIDRTNQRHPNITYTNPSDKRYMLIYLDVNLAYTGQGPGIIFINESEAYKLWEGDTLNYTLLIPPKGTIQLYIQESAVENLLIQRWSEM